MQPCGGAFSARTGRSSQQQEQELAVQQGQEQQMHQPAPTSGGIAPSGRCSQEPGDAAGDDGDCCWDDCDSDSEVNVIVASM